MSGVFKLFRSGEWKEAAASRARSRKKAEPASAFDDAVDTLAAVVRAFGRDSFDTDEMAATEISARCERWAQHVLTGAPLPGEEARLLRPEDRSWGGLRRFFAARRQEEARFVGRSLDTMRSVLWSFVSTLRQSFDEDRRADETVVDQLEELRNALLSSSPEEIKASATKVTQVLDQAFAERRARQEGAIRTLGERLREVKGALQEASESASTDALTGLPNRAAFDERLGSSTTLHAYANQPECLLLLDIDHFKEVNDGFGHRAGDAVLAELGKLLSKLVFRRTDFVSRYGGEEFAVVLDDTNQREGMRVADRLLKAVRNQTVDFDGRPIRVTVSIGVAGIRPGDDEATWLEAADKALYRAKRSGRNRVESRG
jgi:diguanylate cyclase